jgi:dipeptidyl aminopeptidase/acylaminoacyl peptidase
MGKKQKYSPWLIGFIIAGVVGTAVVVIACAGIVIYIRSFLSPTSFPEETESYAQARKSFQTKLVKKAPAPQDWVPAVAPEDVREIDYSSGNLKLKAWVTAPADNAVRRPAVLFLHGGFAFDEDDWDQSQPFQDAGFVVMTPMLRGENGLPGYYSMFYDEVDDVLAAAKALESLPYVDGKRIYVAGHSVGGTLALLAAMSSDRFRAAASFSGSPDQVAWARLQSELVPFDSANDREFRMRSPLAFPKSFKCPVRIYYGDDEFLFDSSSQKLAKLAKAANLDVEAESVPGDHETSVDPGMRKCITFFQQR